MKLRRTSDGQMAFFCPGCKCGHGVHVDSTRASLGNAPVWGWNGSMESPTFTPSINAQWSEGETRKCCHSHVTDGRIQFLTDSTHELSGQTVDLPEFD